MVSNQENPITKKVVSGWAAYGNGWAVHASTRDEAIEKYRERKTFYDELLKRPPIYLVNPKN